MTPIPEHIKANHARLSPSNLEFLNRVEADPTLFERQTFRSVVEDDELVGFPLNPWPLFIDPETMRSIEELSVGLTSLALSLPERFFGNDPNKLAEYYGFEVDLARLFGELLDDPHHMAGHFCRGDYILTPDGFRCLELNISASLGGWESSTWGWRYEQIPAVADILATHGGSHRVRDTFRQMHRHVIRHSQKNLKLDGTMNVVLAVRPGMASQTVVDDYLANAYQEVLGQETTFSKGRLIICNHEKLSIRNGLVYFEDLQVHAVVQDWEESFTQELFACMMAGAINVYNGPLTRLLSDKRSLALLSEYSHSGLFSKAESQWIDRGVPWTRDMNPGPVDFEGSSTDLGELLSANRERFVIKAANSSRGLDVFLGKSCSTSEWEEAVSAAFEADRPWIAQECVESLPMFFQHGESGACPHDVIWGFFTFGREYGGGFLRVMPSDRTGVVNTAQGAQESIFFEVGLTD